MVTETLTWPCCVLMESSGLRYRKMRTTTSFVLMALVGVAALSHAAAFIPQSRSFMKANRVRGGILGARGLKATAAVSSPPKAVKKLSNPAEVLSDIDVFIFDCDGVIWRGDSLIDKVPSVLEKLREQGKR